MDSRSTIEAAAAGLIAGALASFAMDRFQAAVTALSGSDSDAEPATDNAAARLVKALSGHELAMPDRAMGGQLVHYALGAGLGIVYGMMAEHRNAVTTGRGAAFGVVVAVALDNVAVPAVGLGDPPWKTDAETHLYSLASHLVFGAVAEVTRGLLRPQKPGAIGPLLGPDAPSAVRCNRAGIESENKSIGCQLG